MTREQKRNIIQMLRTGFAGPAGAYILEPLAGIVVDLLSQPVILVETTGSNLNGASITDSGAAYYTMTWTDSTQALVIAQIEGYGGGALVWDWSVSDMGLSPAEQASIEALFSGSFGTALAGNGIVFDKQDVYDVMYSAGEIPYTAVAYEFEMQVRIGGRTSENDPTAAVPTYKIAGRHAFPYGVGWVPAGDRYYVANWNTGIQMVTIASGDIVNIADSVAWSVSNRVSDVIVIDEGGTEVLYVSAYQSGTVYRYEMDLTDLNVPVVANETVIAVAFPVDPSKNCREIVFSAAHVVNGRGTFFIGRGTGGVGVGIGIIYWNGVAYQFTQLVGPTGDYRGITLDNDNNVIYTSVGNIYRNTYSGVLGSGDAILPASWTAQIIGPAAITVPGTFGVFGIVLHPDLYQGESQFVYTNYDANQLRILRSVAGGTAPGDYETVAYAGTGAAGVVDGPIATAQFNWPLDMEILGDRILIPNYNGARVQELDMTAGEVVTLSGIASSGYVSTQYY